MKRICNRFMTAFYHYQPIMTRVELLIYKEIGKLRWSYGTGKF